MGKFNLSCDRRVSVAAQPERFPGRSAESKTLAGAPLAAISLATGVRPARIGPRASQVMSCHYCYCCASRLLITCPRRPERLIWRGFQRIAEANLCRLSCRCRCQIATAVRPSLSGRLESKGKAQLENTKTRSGGRPVGQPAAANEFQLQAANRLALVRGIVSVHSFQYLAHKSHHHRRWRRRLLARPAVRPEEETFSPVNRLGRSCSKQGLPEERDFIRSI